VDRDGCLKALAALVEAHHAGGRFGYIIAPEHIQCWGVANNYLPRANVRGSYPRRARIRPGTSSEGADEDEAGIRGAKQVPRGQLELREYFAGWKGSEFSSDDTMAGLVKRGWDQQPVRREKYAGPAPNLSLFPFQVDGCGFRRRKSLIPI